VLELGGANHPGSLGKGHKPVGWSVDLHPTHPWSWKGDPTPLRAVTKRRDWAICSHSRWAVREFVGLLAYMFHIIFGSPPFSCICSALTSMESVIRSRALGRGSQMCMKARARSLLWIVDLIRAATSSASTSWKIRFSIEHKCRGTGGVKGIAKKVMLGVDQCCCRISLSAASEGILVTRKHQGAA
jgi:hypothetical protein